jgi:hypothetical protein
MRRWVPGVADLYCILLAGLLLPFHSLLTNDFWWHLALGEVTLETHTIPRTDTFTDTVPGAALSNHSWLADTLYAGLERASGIGLIEILGALTIALTFRLVYAVSRALGASATASFAAVLAFALLGEGKLILRPLLFTYLGAAWLFLAYVRHREGSPLNSGAPPPGPREGLRPSDSRMILAAPLVTALWANLHGGFLVAPVALAGAGVLAVLERRPARTLFILAGASAVAACIHPDGIGAYGNALENTPLSDPIHTYIDEWQPPNLATVAALKPFLVVAFAVVLCMEKRPPFFELAGFLAGLFLALSSWRHVILFAIVGAPLVAAWATRAISAHAQALEARAPAARRIGGKLDQVLGAFDSGQGGWVLILVASLAAGLGEWRKPSDVLGHPAVRRLFPVEGADWIAAHHLKGTTFNSYQLGGYLAWRLRGEQKVFIDSRLAIFKPIWEDFLHIDDVFPDWRERLARRGPSWAILVNNAKLVPLLELDPKWKLVYADQVVRILVTRDGPNGTLPEVPVPPE